MAGSSATSGWRLQHLTWLVVVDALAIWVALTVAVRPAVGSDVQHG